MANEGVFVYDESGLKGYLKTQPQKNDFVLLAGVLIPEAIRAELQQALDGEFQALDTTGVDKLHATELFQNVNNHPIRDKALRLVRDDERLAVVYEAVSCYGYFNRRQDMRDTRKSAMAARTSSVRLNSHEEIENVYHEALEGLLLKLDCCLEEGSVTMITDPIDPVMLRESEQKVNYLKEQEHTHVVKGFDVILKKPVQGAVISRVENMDVTLHCTYTFQTEESSLTLLADIVTNSVYHHILEQLEAGSTAGLNSQSIMAGHVLENRIILLSDNAMTDLLFPRA